MVLLLAPVAHAQAPIQPYDLSTKDGVQSYIKDEATRQGVPSGIPIKVVQCESQFYGWAIGDHGKAHSLGQFHRETFYRLQKESGLDLKAGWDDYRAQIDILIWAVNHGHKSEWSCIKKIAEPPLS